MTTDNTETRQEAGGETAAFDLGLEDLEIRLGKKLRDHRLARNLSLSEVAKLAEVSVGHLSQIERGLAAPSVRTFCVLSKILGIGPGGLLDDSAGHDDPFDPFVTRAAGRQTIMFNRAGVVKRLASPRSAGSLQMLLVEVEPDSGSGEQGYSHAGEECGIVIEGILDLWIAGERRTLGTGDSFRFPSTMLHRFHNPGSVMTRVIWVTSPPLY
jgi:transcriptional regulator with XRE-family HTH domain